MDPVTAIFLLGCGCIGAYTISRYIDYKKKQLSVETVSAKKGTQSKKLVDWVDDIPMALDQAQQLYDEQLATANAQYGKKVQDGSITVEQAQKEVTAIMKPLKERIDFLNTAKKYEPLVRVGAHVGDKVIKTIEKSFDELV
jgi:hypothetical protein